jgi:hypothetical protein
LGAQITIGTSAGANLDLVSPVFSLPVAILRHLLFRIDGASTVMPERQKIVLHEAARFDAARLVVISFCSRSSAMTEQTGGNANVRRVVDCDAGGGAIPK